MATTEINLRELKPEERARMKKKVQQLLKSLDQLEATAEKVEPTVTDAGCTCSCDCDPNDPPSTKASFHFGKNFANLG